MLMALLLFLRAFVLLEKLITLAAIKSITISCAPSTEGRETKKRLTLARLLKGLKTVNRRDRANPQAPATTTVQFRVSTDEEEEADGFDPLCAINRNPIVGEVYFISIKVSDQGLLCVLPPLVGPWT